MIIRLDGSHGEGGGQIVRTAMALSVLTGKAFEMSSIRSGRQVPGLKAQHLTAIQALRRIAGAQTSDVTIGSQFLRFYPGEIKPGHYTIDIGTAGSITLLLQALLLPLLFAKGPTTLQITGGTCGKWQTPFDFMKEVLLPYLNPFGNIRLDLVRHGYYPKGGGQVDVHIEPKCDDWQASRQFPPLFLEGKTRLLEIRGLSHAASALQPARVAERQAQAARETLRYTQCPVQIQHHYHETRNPGSQITLWAVQELIRPDGQKQQVWLGADAVGEKGKPAEQVGGDAAKRLLQELSSEAPVDEYLSDQLVPFLGLCPGSAMQPPFYSEHLLSNIYVAEQFLPVRFYRRDGVIEVLPVKSE